MRAWALVALWLPWIGACQAPPWSAASIAVACVAPQGAPVADAAVTFHPERAEGEEPIVVLAKARGLIGGATIAAGERERPATVHLRVAARVHGRVRKPPGHVGPVRVSVVRMQTVYVRRDLDRFQEQGFVRTWSPVAQAWLPRVDELDTEVAPDGTFTLDACRESVQLAFTGPGLAEARRWTSQSGAAIDVDMQPEALLDVVVADPAGEPVGGLDVRVCTDGGGERLAWERRSRADGGVRFEGLPAGSYVVTVLAPEMAGHVGRVHAIAGRTTAVPVRLDPGVVLHGHVRDADGSGVAGVRLLASTACDSRLPLGAARTDGDGAFRLRLPRQPVSIQLVDVPDGCTIDTADCAVDVAHVNAPEAQRDFVLARR